MQVNISARHGNLSSSTQEKISEKVEKLRRFNDRITAIHVTADLEHVESPTVEVRLSAEHHNDFVATDEASNVLTALDSVLRKLEQQLRKNKEKLTGHRSPGLKHLEANLEPDTDAE